MWKDVNHQLSQKEKLKMNAKCMKKGFSLSLTIKRMQIYIAYQRDKNYKD